MTKQEAEALIPYARSENAVQYLTLIASGEENSIRGIARRLGKGRTTVQESINRVKQHAAKHGVDFKMGMRGESVPAGFQLDKSTVHIKDGEMIQRWDRVTQDKEDAQKAVMDAIESACAGLPTAPRVATPKAKADGLINLYTIADLHIGLYAWGREGGESYSTADARKILWTCFSDMMDRMPDADDAIICNLGDWIHYDGLLSMTTASHNVLDTDGRYQKLAEVAVGVQSWMIERALQKHKRVKVINAEGNHDEAGSAWLRVMMAHVYRNNPRVTVDDSPAPYYAHLHGQTMLAWHHGHKRKEKDLGGLFASDPAFREMWGQAKRTYIHTGHLHSQSVIELPGAVVERHPTLAARSSYESRGGWQSHRAAKAICYDDKGNERMRVTVTPEGTP